MSDKSKPPAKDEDSKELPQCCSPSFCAGGVLMMCDCAPVTACGVQVLTEVHAPLTKEGH